MNTRMLFIMSLCIVALAAWFYRSQDEIKIHTPMSASNIEYEAINIDAVQTNDQGKIEYLLTADAVTHYTDRNQDELKKLFIDWRSTSARRVQLKAEHGVLDNNTGDITLEQDVVLVSQVFVDASQSGAADSVKPPLTLTADKLMGNMKENIIYSDKPVVVSQGNNTFESNSFEGNMAVGDYTFTQVAVTFLPPNRRDTPLF